MSALLFLCKCFRLNICLDYNQLKAADHMLPIFVHRRKQVCKVSNLFIQILNSTATYFYPYCGTQKYLEDK